LKPDPAPLAIDPPPPSAEAAAARETGSRPSPGEILRTLLWLSIQAVACLAVAGLAAVVLVRVGADLYEGLDPFVASARRPFPGSTRLAARGLSVDVLRQVLLAGIVVGLAVWRVGGGWRSALALDRMRPNGMRPARLLAILLVWPVLHILWVSGTAAIPGANLPPGGTRLSPALTPSLVALWLLTVVVLTPAAEELLMRGALFAQALRRLGGPGAVLVTAAIFAGVHAVSFNLTQPLSLVPLALALGWLRWRTGRLWPCICLHGWSNLVSIAYLLWPLGT